MYPLEPQTQRLAMQIKYKNKVLHLGPHHQGRPHLGTFSVSPLTVDTPAGVTGLDPGIPSTACGM
jgi:hypothetical protein